MNINEKLKKYHQEHLLKFENELSLKEQSELKKQIESLDFSYLSYIGKPQEQSSASITPIDALTCEQIEQNKQEYENIGLNALKSGEVGVLLLAGGMGTRLGSDNPKGMFNVGKTRDLYIFECLINNALKVVKQVGKPFPFFIMTSEKNDKQTQEFLKEHNYFGYDSKYIRFFVQDMAPCTTFDGKILLEQKGRVATSPNGNGGWFNSLLNNASAKQLLQESNVKWLNVFAVDNVLQQIADPVFVGATLKSNCQIGAKVIRKADPYEKVGVMCKKDGKPSIVEYIDLGEEMALATNEKGERLYNFGVILNYLFNVDLLYKIKDKSLPVHVVTKKIEYVNDEGEVVKPAEPNGHKFEMLCVDMIELADSCLPFEVEREKEFAPIKNKTGVDSVESAQALLEKNGVTL
ncbi:MAG: UTP--glucose-1-phosphate uridylyltransferase [Clostridia bacterium]|nr:UTP--glucose-1-phosphate uridylyltransferase [Clostridia bacterium]